jgi:hypothetical protein
MSELIMAESATPSTPSTGKVKIFTPTQTVPTIAILDDAGVLGKIAINGAFTLTVPATGTAVYLTTGSWTPALKFGGATTGITYSSNTGIYYTLSNETIQLVYAYWDFTLSSKGSATGAATITGLPQNILGTGRVRFLQNMTTVADIVIRCSGTTIDLTQLTTSAIVNMDDTDFQNTTRFNGHVIGHN